MIKISVMYPNTPGVHFDHDYYRDVHMPLVQERLGSSISSYDIDKGLADAPYVAMCHLYSESVAAFEAGLAPHGEALNADIAHFTTALPVYQISEVVR